MAKRIVVIGSANIDLVIHSERLPTLGETLSGGDFQINSGGKGLNQAVAIAKLGGDVTFLGAVGDDIYGDVLRETLRQNAVAYTPVDAEGAPTGVAMITVVGGDNCIILDAGANAKLTPEAVAKYADVIAESDFCVLQLEIPLETVQAVCDIAKANGTKIVLNPAPFCALPCELLTSVDYLIPNEHEARLLTGIDPDTEEHCYEAVTAIKQMGVNGVVITLGERGCVYSVDEETICYPAQNTTVVDTTSAGDCFIGALVSKLAQDESFADAVVYATKASAITVSREGAAKSIPFAHEIDK